MKKLFAALLAVLTVLLTVACSSESTDDTVPESSATETTQESPSESTSTGNAIISKYSIGNFVLSLSDGMDYTEHEDMCATIMLRASKAYVLLYATDISGLGSIADTYVQIQHESLTEDRGDITDETPVQISICGFTAEGEQYFTENDNGVSIYNLDVSFSDTEYAYTALFYCNAGDGNLNAYKTLFTDLFNSAEYLGPVPMQEESLATTETTESAPLGSIDNPYSSGMYKVGQDLPAGEYLFLATSSSSAYVCVSSDSNQNDIIENANFDHSYFLTVSDGQYLKTKRCAFVYAEGYTVNINDDGSVPAGMYRVGIDIPAGEYKLTADDGESGYYCIYQSSEVPFDIVNNDNFEGSVYVTVTAGQYITIKRCTGDAT